MVTYGAPAPTRRATVLVTILLVHAAFVGALLQFGPGEAPQILPPRISLLKLISLPKPPPEPPALSATMSAPPAPFIPPPEIHITPPELRIQASKVPMPTPMTGVSQIPASGHGVPEGVRIPPSPPVFTAKDSPAYPKEYRDSGAQAYVSVACVIQTDGIATGCHVVYLDGRPAFGQTVLDWLQNGQKRYRPATVNGEPVTQAAALKFYFVPNAAGRE